MSHPFFKNYGPILISEILKYLDIKIKKLKDDKEILDIKDLYSSTNSDITFYHSKKYKEIAKNTKASFCITTESLKNDLSKNCNSIIVENVLVSVSKLTSKFYPESINDNFDETAISISETKFKDEVKFGKNVLVGDNVTFGSNCYIGHNSIIEKNVNIGNNCSIGSNTIIRNTIIKDNIIILDGCVIGKHGFGFFPIKNQNQQEEFENLVHHYNNQSYPYLLGPACFPKKELLYLHKIDCQLIHTPLNQKTNNAKSFWCCNLKVFSQLLQLQPFQFHYHLFLVNYQQCHNALKSTMNFLVFLCQMKIL